MAHLPGHVGSQWQETLFIALPQADSQPRPKQYSKQCGLHSDKLTGQGGLMKMGNYNIKYTKSGTSPTLFLKFSYHCLKKEQTLLMEYNG